MRCSLVVAADLDDVIGADGGLPWRLPEDLAEFRRRTLGGVLVAGRATQDAIGRALPQRHTLVLTRDPGYVAVEGTEVVRSWDEAHERARSLTRERGRDEFFVVGGAVVYDQALPHADRVHLTRVHAHVPGDTALPPGWLRGFAREACSEVRTQNGFDFTFETWVRA